MTTITVSYKVNGQFGIADDMDKRLTDLAEEHGGESVGSGSGFGLRDLEFEFGRAKDTKVFKKKARKIIGKNGSISSLGIHELVHVRYWKRLKEEDANGGNSEKKGNERVIPICVGIR